MIADWGMAEEPEAGQPAPQPGRIPPVKGAWINGGYVIVTPARGVDPRAVMAAILKLAEPAQ